jgi:hypothetical protein
MPKPRTKLISLQEFRRQRPAAGAGVPIRAGVSSTVKAVGDDPESRILEFTISTASVDRYGDTIAVDGWELENYKKNPVVLWAHDNDSLPVAKCTKIFIEGGALKALTDFTPAGPNWPRFNETVYEMYLGGYLSATSVGFMPMEWKWNEDPAAGRDGIDFLRQELLEFSAVVVPANPEALIAAKSAGIDTAPMIEWAERLLDGEGRISVSRAELEQLRRAAGAPARLASMFRNLAKTLPATAKGASGQLLRCAKIADAENLPDPETPTEDQVEQDDAVTENAPDPALAEQEVAARAARHRLVDAYRHLT